LWTLLWMPNANAYKCINEMTEWMISDLSIQFIKIL
jgi:hypothetical protein